MTTQPPTTAPPIRRLAPGPMAALVAIGRRDTFDPTDFPGGSSEDLAVLNAAHLATKDRLGEPAIGGWRLTTGGKMLLDPYEVLGWASDVTEAQLAEWRARPPSPFHLSEATWELLEKARWHKARGRPFTLDLLTPCEARCAIILHAMALLHVFSTAEADFVQPHHVLLSISDSGQDHAERRFAARAEAPA